MHILEASHGLSSEARDRQRSVFTTFSSFLLTDHCHDIYDIDVLIQLDEDQAMEIVRERIKELDPHFAQASLKFFFVQVRNVNQRR